VRCVCVNRNNPNQEKTAMPQWKYGKGTETKKHLRDAKNDDYSDYGNYGPNQGNKQDTEPWTSSNKAYYDRIGSKDGDGTTYNKPKK
jgi:hypothetical protein